MIDLHSHILPGIDDGAKTLDDAIAMAEQSVQAGVTHMMCTPHVHQGVYDNTQESITRAFDGLLNALHQRNIDLKLAHACEVRVSLDIVQWVSKQQLGYIGHWQGKQVLLLEMPHSHVPPGIENLIRWLLKNNVQPVIPHPERNREIQADFSKAIMLRRLGVLFQVTAGVLTSAFGQKPYDTAVKLIVDDMIDYVASDTHSVLRRPNEMGACKRELGIHAGEDKAQALLFDTPKLITSNITWQ